MTRTTEVRRGWMPASGSVASRRGDAMYDEMIQRSIVSQHMEDREREGREARLARTIAAGRTGRSLRVRLGHALMAAGSVVAGRSARADRQPRPSPRIAAERCVEATPRRDIARAA
jgi:hypothetical protein